MKKKIIKRLALKKSTVQNLNDDAANGIRGGNTLFFTCNGLTCDGNTICNVNSFKSCPQMSCRLSKEVKCQDSGVSRCFPCPVVPTGGEL
jgi:hypothetical protein